MTSAWARLLAVFVVLGLTLLASPGASLADDTAALYKSKCALCHGDDGKGDNPTGKAMKVKDFASPDVKKKSDADLTEAITKGKGDDMPPFKTLTADQIKGLVEYVRAFAKKK